MSSRTLAHMDRQKYAFLALVLVVVSVVSDPSDCAAEEDLGWVEIPAATSRLVFQDPGLNFRPGRFLRRKHPDDTIIDWGYWQDSGEQSADLELFYTDLPHDMVFASKSEKAIDLRAKDYFADEPATFGKPGKATNRLGSLEYVRVSLGQKHSCLFFRQYFGVYIEISFKHGDSLGTSVLEGRYCRLGLADLDEATVTRVFESFEIRSRNRRVQLPALSSDNYYCEGYMDSQGGWSVDKWSSSQWRAIGRRCPQGALTTRDIYESWERCRKQVRWQDVASTCTRDAIIRN